MYYAVRNIDKAPSSEYAAQQQTQTIKAYSYCTRLPNDIHLQACVVHGEQHLPRNPKKKRFHSV